MDLRDRLSRSGAAPGLAPGDAQAARPPLGNPLRFPATPAGAWERLRTAPARAAELRDAR